MSVIETDKWLLESYNRPIEICEKLRLFFDGVYASEIYDYLLLHGMYDPLTNGKDQITKLQRKQVWEIVQHEVQILQKLWKGPDIPIFIFPSDTRNEIMKKEFNGKAGLSFKDKIFLFISEENHEAEIRSLLTHEYNHVCRLTYYSKVEDDYTLLDTIILEGLAENAVRERIGEKFMSSWTSYYTDKELQIMWEKFMAPNRTILKTDPKHHEILYGSALYPKMAGYSVGYFLVKKYMAIHHLTSKDVLSTEPAQFSL
ncbi:DUF2268 domain-containing protein [Niallia sp. Krafla_26]|uniref:DUF2268 domain-containing protein n=1 Tax=Niallia sp. Krafla_26 TaxID=3064703 RepID=UPI003D18205F